VAVTGWSKRRRGTSQCYCEWPKHPPNWDREANGALGTSVPATGAWRLSRHVYRHEQRRQLLYYVPGYLEQMLTALTNAAISAVRAGIFGAAVGSIGWFDGVA